MEKTAGRTDRGVKSADGFARRDMNRFSDRVFVIDKQRGPTSFEIVDAFRAATGTRRVGHAGTLDPLASGVLLLCADLATRVVEHFVNLSKWYEFDVYLGEGTSTLDAEGEVTSRAPCPDLTKEELVEAARSFTGEVLIAPPLYSAIKKNGRRMYELAREGKVPRVESKRVTVYSLEITGIDLPIVRFRLNCSRGTYVRSLARDFGARFDLPAHVRNLVRTAVGPFRVEDAYDSRRIFEGDIGDLEGAALSDALDFLPAIVINPVAKRELLRGRLPDRNDVVRTIGECENAQALRILDESEELLAVGSRQPTPARNPLACVDSYRLLVGGERQEG
jgi:tRNA pseudouridine55 synthase